MLPVSPLAQGLGALNARDTPDGQLSGPGRRVAGGSAAMRFADFLDHSPTSHLSLQMEDDNRGDSELDRPRAGGSGDSGDLAPWGRRLLKCPDGVHVPRTKHVRGRCRPAFLKLVCIVDPKVQRDAFSW